MKKFSYEFFMRSILSEDLSRYKMKMYFNFAYHYERYELNGSVNVAYATSRRKSPYPTRLGCVWRNRETGLECNHNGGVHL